MTIIVEIRPEVQAELSRQAAAHGVDIGAYAATLLEEAAHVPAGSKTLSQSQLDNTLEELAQFSLLEIVLFGHLADEALHVGAMGVERDRAGARGEHHRGGQQDLHNGRQAHALRIR